MSLSTATTAASYDAIPDFGDLYDAVPVYRTRGDVAFYVEEARSAGGPVLELGCGTGRILLPIARAGIEVTGIEGSTAMLARARAMLEREDADVRARATLHQGDARDFTLGRRFALIIAPFRILQHLTTIDDQLSCLAAIGRHLEPNGRLVFDVFNPHFSYLVRDRTAETEDTPRLTLPDGRTMRRASRVLRVRWHDQVSETELVYYVAPRAGAEEARFVQSFEMRWYLRDELTHLLARAGFRIDAFYGNFDRSPLTEPSPEMIVSARRD